MTNRNLLYRLAPLLLAFLGFTGTASAELLLSVNDGTITPGGTLRIEVGLGTNDPSQGLADIFPLVLQITNLSGSGDSSLVFVDPQSEDYLEEADYVFFENSDVVLNPGEPATEVQNFGNRIEISDLAHDFENEFAMPGNFIAAVELQHALGSQSFNDVIGNQFRISVSEDPLDGTFLFDADGDDVPFIPTSGTITVTAIPEPGVAGLLCLAAGGLVMRRSRRY